MVLDEEGKQNDLVSNIFGPEVQVRENQIGMSTW